jgi:hypothetical protein
MQIEDLELLRIVDHTQARVQLLALIRRLSDAEAAALWALICSWYREPTSQPETAYGSPLPAPYSKERRTV